MLYSHHRNLLNLRLAEETAVWMTRGIAIMDIILAVLVLLVPGGRRRHTAHRVGLPVLMGWMACWGLLTAFSRMTALGGGEGWSEYLDVLVRTPHVFGPLALWALLMSPATHRPLDHAQSHSRNQ